MFLRKKTTAKSKQEDKKLNQNEAAAKIQGLFRGYRSRKKTNIFGKSQGKEVEVYLPLCLRDMKASDSSYEDVWFAGYKLLLCKSDLFYVHMDTMPFLKDGLKYRTFIAEIVTVPTRQPEEHKTNLRTENEIDLVVYDFLLLLETFSRQSSKRSEVSFLPFTKLLQQYNEKHPKHPLILGKDIKECLNNESSEFFFVFDKNFYPNFYFEAGPKTDGAAIAVAENHYVKEGQLLVHIQKTFSLPIQHYSPDILSERFNHTPQQIEFLHEARNRSKQLIKKFPLPKNADQEKILGLLTICVEQIITETLSYTDLYEKADRPIFSMRHILHYLRNMLCNSEEINWFTHLFQHQINDIFSILSKDAEYRPHYYGKEREYGSENGLANPGNGYDVIFDLFGDFSNKSYLSEEDKKSEYTMQRAEKYDITSWAKLFENHKNLSGRTHLRLQKTYNKDNQVEYHPLFEARRLQLMTIEDFRQGKSCVAPPQIIQDEKQSACTVTPMKNVRDGNLTGSKMQWETTHADDLTSKFLCL